METQDGGKGNDRGFLWRLNTYWRYQEKNGGVYIQVEFIPLEPDCARSLRLAGQPLH